MYIKECVLVLLVKMKLKRKVMINKKTNQWSITIPKKELLKFKKEIPKWITINTDEGITW